MRTPFLTRPLVIASALAVSGLTANLISGAEATNQAALGDGQGPSFSPIGSTDCWRLIARVTGQIQYDDNLFIQPTNEKSDFSFHLAPTIGAGIGNFRTELAPFSPVPHVLVQTGEEELPERNFAFISYTPEAVLYRDYTGEDTVNHDVRIAGQRDSDLLHLQGSLRYQSYNDASIEVGARLRQIAYTANLDGSYNVSAKTAIGARFLGMHTDFADANSATDGRASLYANYEFGPKTTLGLGYTMGRLDVDVGGDQTYSRPWVEVRYDATSKLLFRGQLGEDIRSFPAMGTRSRFVFDLNGTYLVGENFQMMIEAQRDVQSSALYAAENVIASLYQIGARRQVFSRNFVSAFAGYTTNRYEANDWATLIPRSDNYHFYKLAVARDVTSRGTLQLSYEYRTNNSNLRQYNFNENVVTATFSFVF